MAERARRCAIYTRKSTEDGLDQAFNSLDAQHDARVAYALSQRHEGWALTPERYDDGGFSGGTMRVPASPACSPTWPPARSTSFCSTRSTG